MRATTGIKLPTRKHTGALLTVFSNPNLLETSGLSAEDKILSLESLQQSLDLKEMLTNFAALVEEFIRPLNIRFQSAHGFFNLIKQQQYKHTQHFNLGGTGLTPRLGCISYQSEKKLCVREEKILTELHQLLLPLLKHALTFSDLNSKVYQDHLTNIGNRAYYDKAINHAIEQSNRSQLGLSLMLFDVNDFKPINDTYGHLKGDQVLREFASILTNNIRASDMAFRLGGDEFAVILQPSASCSIAKVHQRILQASQENCVLKQLGLTFSLGFSHWEMGVDAAQLFEIADKNLYQHKALGKA